MHLITMAHLGEAQGVIELFNLKRISSQVFEGEDIVCLITGEGPFEAATTTASLLGQKKYQSVINLGIAGSLSTEYEIGSIHQVRSVYLAIDGKPQFKSFKSFEQGLDCVTSFERILSTEKALPLSGIANLVDREAWGVAMAAKGSSVPFQAHKLISDQAGSLGACEVAKEMAEEWSKKLATHLQMKLLKTDNGKESIELPGFYFTFSTQIQLKQVLKQYSLREDKTVDEILRELPLEHWREQKILPKERTRLLLEHMEEKLDPLLAKLNMSLKEWKAPFEKQNIQIVTDPKWEDSNVKLSFSAADQRDMENKLKILKDLNLNDYFSLRNGDSL